VCLAIPGKITKLDQKKQSAVIDYGSGTTRKANVSLVQVKIGDYVLVHAGFAIQVLDEKEAKETLALFKEMLSLQEEG
jgi:hydrogenase expression/formation protein HypC